MANRCTKVLLVQARKINLIKWFTHMNLAQIIENTELELRLSTQTQNAALKG
jgi:hypothetical protein